MNVPLTNGLAVLYVLFAFLCGALPFSVWLGKLALRADVRNYGDGNPGATNVLRAGGWRLGLIALMLDVSKGAFPVGLACFTFGWRGWAMLPIALAPTLGHVFSPFLKGRGGKGLAVTLGVWIGLTLGEVPIILLSSLVFWFAWLAVDGWAVALTGLSLFAYLGVHHPDPLLLSVAVGQAVIIFWTHRADLRKRPALRAWVWKVVPGWLKPQPLPLDK